MRLFPPEGCRGKDIENNTSEGEEEAIAHRRKNMIRLVHIPGEKGNRRKGHRAGRLTQIR